MTRILLLAVSTVVLALIADSSRDYDRIAKEIKRLEKSIVGQLDHISKITSAEHSDTSKKLHKAIVKHRTEGLAVSHTLYQRAVSKKITKSDVQRASRKFYEFLSVLPLISHLSSTTQHKVGPIFDEARKLITLTTLLRMF